MIPVAIYPGTFDPITLGHLDLIGRAAKIVDRLIIAIGVNTKKAPLFEIEERMTLVRETVQEYKNVEVDSFDGLLVDYARRKRVGVLVRGIRAFSDFEFEFQMALTNRKMAPEIETIFLMPNESYSYLSSSTVREIVEMGGHIDDFVPEPVLRALKKRLSPR